LTEDTLLSVSHKLPNGQALVDPLSLNLYTYAYNNPVMFHDPSGHAGELALAWSGGMWWLCGVDLMLPIGDIIYVAGIGICSIADAIAAIGMDNVVRIICEAPQAIVQGAQWVGDKVGQGIDWVGDQVRAGANSVGNWFDKTFGGGTSPGDPDWNGGFNSFRKLKNYLGSAGDGKVWHHIVEQNQISKSGFDKTLVHNVNNVISVTSEMNTKIASHYNSIIPGLTNGMTVRNWLAGQSFQFQYEYGLKVLRDFGVIK